LRLGFAVRVRPGASLGSPDAADAPRRTWRSVTAWLVASLLALHGLGWSPLEAIQPKPTYKMMYILPNWLNYQGASDAVFDEEVRQLRSRIGEGRYVRVGFTVYIFISMENWYVDVDDQAAVDRELQQTFDQMDRAVARARIANIPVCLSLLTAIRGRYDPAQRSSEREDRRNMQWYADNELARGWWTHSRYARKLRRVQEAYIRAVGRHLAGLMAQYPGTVVAASGDGEVELSYDRAPAGDPAYANRPAVLADYSPFAVAEFRDWLRHGGLYADGQPFAGQGYEHGARYKGDRSPADDTNRDGHTLNGDFGTRFTSWDLRYFDWNLDDNPDADPHAIPASVYESLTWNPMPDAGPDRFDAPRGQQPGQPFWEVWNLFRQTMVWRHNRDFARWITTSPDPATGLTVPAERWFSDQIPADYLFGGTPANPNERLESSASPWWTADISPYGAVGVTAFNVVLGGTLYPTLRNVAPVIAERKVRWGVLEYHPSVPTSNLLSAYFDDVAVLERYRPAVIVPIFWGDAYYQIQNTPFEQALRELVNRVKDGPRGVTASAPQWTEGPRGAVPASAQGSRLPVLLDGKTQVEWLGGRQRPWWWPR